MNNIEKVFTVSTTNISIKTARLLDIQQPESLTIYPKGDFGWFIAIPKDLEFDKIPADLALLIGYAVFADCKWLQIDRDAEYSTSLPTYE